MIRWPRRKPGQVIFGGSVLALAPSASLDAVRDAITSAFAERAWTAPEFLSATPADAARQVE